MSHQKHTLFTEKQQRNAKTTLKQNFREFTIIIQNIRPMNFTQSQLAGIKEASVESFRNFYQSFPSLINQKGALPNITQACSFYDQMSEQGEWRTNQLISDVPIRKRSSSLRKLTSFEQRSIDQHGRRLSESFLEYITWANQARGIFEKINPRFNLSLVEWETIENEVMMQDKLSEHEKSTLIGSAQRNPQSELLITEIFYQIPTQYYAVALALTSALIQQFDALKLTGRQNEEILYEQIQQRYGTFSDQIYSRLFAFGVANLENKNSQRYRSFVRTWMEVLFVALHGYLENPLEQRNPLEEFEFEEQSNRNGKKMRKCH